MHRAARCFFLILAIGFIGVISASAAQAQMCVRYARSLTDFTIRGDAWTWWDGASERYERGKRPAVGSVLVFKRTGSMRRGHVSTVSAVIDDRTILVDHSWVRGQGLHRNMRIVDVSPGNDWSRVRVWHPPTDSLGIRHYPTYGFIYPEDYRSEEAVVLPISIRPPRKPARSGVQAAAEPIPIPDRKPEGMLMLVSADSAVVPTGRGIHRTSRIDLR